MYIAEDDKRKILKYAAGKLVEVIGEFTELKKSGAELKGRCPKCGHNSGLSVSQSKQLFKCFHCNDVAGKTPLDWLMKVEGKSYPEALTWLADKFNILLTQPDEKPLSKKLIQRKAKANSYCARMLAESGLSEKDITAKVYKSDDTKTIFQSKTFAPGTISGSGEIDGSGDDVIIHYYDLDGFPVKYVVKDKKGNATGEKPFFRVRWQFPADHCDRSGKPMKYRTPPKAGSPIYLPERIRAAYKAKEQIDRLYIQEGEKKAEKACKHGILSIGIAGIQNLGYDGQLPEAVVKLVQECGVKEVVFMLDSDCFDISSALTITENIAMRPQNFFYAVRNFRDYFRTLINRNIYVEAYFGYLLKNAAQEKGVDDVLTGSLAGKEGSLLDDLTYAINEKSLTGTYVKLHRITTFTDHKLREIWDLHNHVAFCERYKDTLKDMPEFTYFKHRLKFSEDGELVSTQPIEDDEKYWEEETIITKRGTEKKVYEFNYVRCMRFLRNRGFGRHLRPSGDTGFIHIQYPFVRTIETWEMKDFISEFTEMNANEGVLNMIYRGGAQYLGPYHMGNLKILEAHFVAPLRGSHFMYFKDDCWEITGKGIVVHDHTAIKHHVWADMKKDFAATRLPEPLIQVGLSDDAFSYRLSESGKKCHFLRFLENTSNFSWRKEQLIKEGKPDVIITPEERYDNTLHLIAKLCAIGYMVVGAKDRSTAKAVVAMDGRQSEVGASNGRSGKSIIGEMLKHVSSAVYINGKTIDLESDRFIWDELTEKTRTVFVDDVRPGFNFELLFANITGDWSVNFKGGRRCTYPFTASPKIYLTTNHTLKGEGSSFRDRQWIIAFSDFYNDKHKPIDDFKLLFFDEWESEQWNLLWNLLAECARLYFKYGCVESPSERIEVRRLRQLMGETFLQWADEYFSDESRRNKDIPRSELYRKYLDDTDESKKYCSPPVFKKKVKGYCTYKGYQLNPQKYDPETGLPFFFDKDGAPIADDKRGGVEYFTIGDENFAKSGFPDSVLNEDLNINQADF